MVTLSSLISGILRLYALLIFLRVVLSWVRASDYGAGLQHPLVQLLYRITDPVIEPLRRLIPPIGGAIDITPIVALLLLELVRWILLALLNNI